MHDRKPAWLITEYNLDPVSLGIGLLGLIGGGVASSAMGGSAPKPSPVPAAPAAQAAPTQAPQGSAGSNRPSGAPSFLAAAAAPQGGNTTGGKTLLGA